MEATGSITSGDPLPSIACEGGSDFEQQLPSMLPSPADPPSSRAETLSFSSSEENSGTGCAQLSRAILPHETTSPAVSSTLDPQPSTLPFDPTAKRRAEYERRADLWRAWRRLQRRGFSHTTAAPLLNKSPVTLWRLDRAVRAQGRAAFWPATANCGRPDSFAVLLADETFVRKLDEIYQATIGASGANVVKGRRTAKMATALACFAEENECPPALAGRLRRGRFPVSLLRHLKRITPEIENRVRGAKNYQLNGASSRRDLTLRFPDGTRAEMPAGFKWVFDDMSANQPFWCRVDGTIMFSRQGLYALDHRSLRWLGKMLVARPREAYRAEDILRFLRLLFGLYGKPDLIVFERGVWHARKIRGLRLERGCVADQPQHVEEEDFLRPEMPETQRHLLGAGLKAIGVQVLFANSAHGKIIETCFNHLQSVLAIKARGYVNIGRYAGEFEAGAKRMRQVRAGSHEPLALGFATLSELSDALDAAFAHINGKQNSRREVPDAIWSAGLAARPLPPLAGNDAAAFLPECRNRAIDAGRVTATVDGHIHDFRADWMITLGHGYRVFCKFDPAEPSLGAAIYNRETGANNRRLDDPARGYQLGELIGFAQWEMPAPSADVGDEWVGRESTRAGGISAAPISDFYGRAAFDQGDTLRRKQDKLVATAYSALPHPGAPAVKRLEALDGAGRVTRIDSGRRPAAALNALPPARNTRTKDSYAELFGG